MRQNLPGHPHNREILTAPIGDGRDAGDLSGALNDATRPDGARP